MPVIGAIADDFTGATDLATNLVTSGFRTLVTVGVPAATAAMADVDAVVVALKTRTAPREQAVDESLAALAALQELGCERCYLKYCSTFDSTPAGNIGPVADALLDALAAPLAVVVPSFPENRRVVVDGTLLVDGVPLAEGPMRHHPLTPMLDSDVVRLLTPQSRHSVGLVRHATVRSGADALREELRAAADQGHRLVVVDATTDADLAVIAEATADHRLVTGGSGLALGMAGPRRDAADRVLPAAAPGRSAILVGSTSAASRRQIRHAREHLPSRHLSAQSLRHDAEAHLAALAEWAEERWSQEPEVPVLIYSADLDGDATGPADQGAARPGEAGARRPDAATSLAIERAFGELAGRFAAGGTRRLIIGGGETSGTVTQALGVTLLHIGPQIQPGVAWAHGTSTDPADAGYILALKSGNFGSDDFLTSAWGTLT